MDHTLGLEVWTRLSQGRSLDELPLERKDGRIDIRGINLPEVSVVRTYQTSIANVKELGGTRVVRRRKWENLDFAGSNLSNVRLFDCAIHNCRFDDCRFEDLRIWSSKFSQTSFTGASLREAVLGGVQDGRRNAFSNVDFTRADLQQSMYTAATFEGCVFRNTRLVKIDFQTTTFSDCTFEGELRNVIFFLRGFKGDPFPANEMRNIDFSKAKLRFVEFRGLDLDRVKLPEDAEHIIIAPYAQTLDRMLEALDADGDLTARVLGAYLRVYRKWAGLNQLRGVFNTEDFREIAGEPGAQRILSLLRKLESTLD